SDDSHPICLPLGRNANFPAVEVDQSASYRNRQKSVQSARCDDWPTAPEAHGNSRAYGVFSMITAEGCQGRRQRLWDRLAEKPDWIIITDPQHLTYFANYVVNPFIFRGANSMAVLILGADG